MSQHQVYDWQKKQFSAAWELLLLCSTIICIVSLIFIVVLAGYGVF